MRTLITGRKRFHILVVAAFLALVIQVAIIGGCKAKKPAPEQAQPEQTSIATGQVNAAEKTGEAQKTGIARDTVKGQGEPARKKVAVVDAARCIGCGVCINACPNGAISLVNGKAVIDPKKCKIAGNCQKVCPVGAIAIR